MSYSIFIPCTLYFKTTYLVRFYKNILYYNFKKCVEPCVGEEGMLGEKKPRWMLGVAVQIYAKTSIILMVFHAFLEVIHICHQSTTL